MKPSDAAMQKALTLADQSGLPTTLIYAGELYGMSLWDYREATNCRIMAKAYGEPIVTLLPSRWYS